MKGNKSLYGEMLVQLIRQSRMSQAEFYQKLEIKKPYFYDIISGKANPPPARLQLKIIEILQPTDADKNKLLKEASVVRDEIPADIYLYLKSNQDEYENLRKKFVIYSLLTEEE